MIRRIVIMLSCILAPVLAHAQTVPVRSGEHANFTRLVFDLPRRVDWTLEPGTDQVTLRLAAGKWTFDTRSVFDRIRRERVRNLTADPESPDVLIELGCPCDVTAFWHGRAMLVVDVRDPDDTEALARVKPDERSSLVLDHLRRGFASQSEPARLLQERFPLQSSEPVPPVSGSVPAAGPGDALRASQQTLVEQFSRAASQGLLTLDTPLSERGPISMPQASSEEPVAVKTADAPSQTSAANPLRNINIDARSSMDRAFLETLMSGAGGLEARACPDPASGDVASWGTDQPFSDQVGPLRAKLFSEFDREDPKAAEKLTKLYLHFGFGSEALQVLSLLPETWPEREILVSLAEIMKTGYADTGSAFQEHADCPSSAALWAILSRERLSDGINMDIDAAIRAFSGLPQHLRAYLGPTLARRFLRAGMADESDRVLRILDRSDGTVSAQSQFARAELDMQSGRPELADQRFDVVVSTSSEPSALALVRKIEARLASDQPVSYDVAQLAGAYAHEHADGELGPDLHRVHILALAASGAYEEAFEEFERLSSLSSPMSDDIRNTMARIVTQSANEFDFLRFALSGRFGPPEALETSTALSIAQRFFDAGFPTSAGQFLKTPLQGPVARDMRILKARIALAENRPRQAEVELLGLTGKDVNLLRAHARSKTGSHAQAQELYRSAGLEDEAAREAWLASDLPGIVEDETSIGKDPAKPTVGASDDQPEGVLQKNRALLDGTAQMRTSIEAMLAATPAPLHLAE